MRELLSRMKYNPATARKFIAAILGAVATAIAVGVLPTEYTGYVSIAVAFFTALGVYVVPNENNKEEDYNE